MKNNKKLQQFNRECKLINLRYEYTGYTNDIQWAIVTELSEEEILQKYPEEIKQYIPFIRLSVSQGEVFEDSKRNENKYRMREKRCGHIFDITDDDLENYHPELIVTDTEDTLTRKDEVKTVQTALNTLSKSNRERVYKFFFLGMNYSEIARDEGLCESSIRRSIENSVKKLKTFYEKMPN